MTTSTPSASLADLSRWLRVDEGDTHDRLELASAWQRLPFGSPDRLTTQIGAGMAALIIGLLLLQAGLTQSRLVLAIALVGVVLAAGMAWRLRGWFWRTVVEVDNTQLVLSYRGWGVPVTATVTLDDIRALTYQMDAGHLLALRLEHQHGSLPIPFSGQRELDKLFYNLLKHLLQKRRPAIGFGNRSEQA